MQTFKVKYLKILKEKKLMVGMLQHQAHDTLGCIWIQMDPGMMNLEPDHRSKRILRRWSNPHTEMKEEFHSCYQVLLPS